MRVLLRARYRVSSVFLKRGRAGVMRRDRCTYFCLKYSRELKTAAMPCRHCKFIYDEAMRGNELEEWTIRIIKYRRDKNR